MVVSICRRSDFNGDSRDFSSASQSQSSSKYSESIHNIDLMIFFNTEKQNDPLNAAFISPNHGSRTSNKTFLDS